MFLQGSCTFHATVARVNILKSSPEFHVPGVHLFSKKRGHALHVLLHAIEFHGQIGPDVPLGHKFVSRTSFKTGCGLVAVA